MPATHRRGWQLGPGHGQRCAGASSPSATTRRHRRQPTAAEHRRPTHCTRIDSGGPSARQPSLPAAWPRPPAGTAPSWPPSAGGTTARGRRHRGGHRHRRGPPPRLAAPAWPGPAVRRRLVLAGASSPSTTTRHHRRQQAATVHRRPTPCTRIASGRPPAPQPPSLPAARPRPPAEPAPGWPPVVATVAARSRRHRSARQHRRQPAAIFGRTPTPGGGWGAGGIPPRHPSVAGTRASAKCDTRTQRDGGAAGPEPGREEEEQGSPFLLPSLLSPLSPFCPRSCPRFILEPQTPERLDATTTYDKGPNAVPASPVSLRIFHAFAPQPVARHNPLVKGPRLRSRRGPNYPRRNRLGRTREHPSAKRHLGTTHAPTETCRTTQSPKGTRATVRDRGPNYPCLGRPERTQGRQQYGYTWASPIGRAHGTTPWPARWLPGRRRAVTSANQVTS